MLGKKCTFDEDTEDHLKKCIIIVCNCDFSPLMNEVQINEFHFYSFKVLKTNFETVLI